MINVTFASSDATTRTYCAELAEKLCQPYCVNSGIQPIVEVVYSITDKTLVGTTLYVRIKAQGEVTYVPKNGNACCPKSKIFTEYFSILLANATSATTVTLAQSAGLVEPAFVNCYNVACGISALNQLTFTIG